MDCRYIDKPKDWPINNKEANLERISTAIDKFYDSPTYKNKEILFALINIIDLNEIDERGLLRFSEYEVAVLNELYTKAVFLNCQSLKIYLYSYIERRAREHKMFFNMGILNGETSQYKEI